MIKEINLLCDAHITLICPDTKPFLAQLAPGNCDVHLIGIDESKPGFMSFAPVVEKYFSEKPCDLLVIDMDPLMWISTTCFPDIPQAYITNIFLTRVSDHDTFQKATFPSLSNKINSIRRGKGLSELTTIEEVYERDLVLLADPLNIIGLYGDLPNNYIPVGPCSFDTGGMTLPKELVSLDSVLLVSFGSTGDIKLVQPTIELLLEHNHFDALIWVGEQPECTNLPAAPVTFVYPWLPLEALLPKAKLVVTHGGTGSTYQALKAGKPVVCCPRARNHRILSAIIEQLYLGVSIEDGPCLEKLSHLDLAALQSRVQAVAAGRSFQYGPGRIAKSLIQLAGSSGAGISKNR